MNKKNTIVIYGGSFNPPLNSHFSIAQQVINEYEEVEKIIFVPVNKTYPKEDLEENKYRYDMVKMITDKNKNFEISDIDFKQDYSMNTVDVLDEIQKEYKDKQLWFLTGSDNLKYISKWDGGKELLKKYIILVIERDKDNINEIIDNDEVLQFYKANIMKLKEGIKSNYNSTYVRNQIKNKKNVRYLMPDEIYKYIKNNNLYKE